MRLQMEMHVPPRALHSSLLISKEIGMTGYIGYCRYCTTLYCKIIMVQLLTMVLLLVLCCIIQAVVCGLVGLLVGT